MNAGSSKRDVPVKTIVPKTKWQNSSDDMRGLRKVTKEQRTYIVIEATASLLTNSVWPTFSPWRLDEIYLRGGREEFVRLI